MIFSDVGDENGDSLGFALAISGDGMYMAAGAGEYAKLYTRSGMDWNMIQRINYARSLDLSHDGSTLAVGSGSVYIYDLNNVTGVYDLFHTTDDVRAHEVSLSGDGMVVGVTSGSYSGARIYERIGNVFQQRGTDIFGYGFDSGIDLNYNGTVVIVGDHYWSSDDGNINGGSIGRAAVFQWRGENGEGSMEWMQIGSNFTGDDLDTDLGCEGCLSITYDGLTVAVGASEYDRDYRVDRGLVRVYNHDSTSDTWVQIGSDLVGDDDFASFSRTALSSNGTYLAVGTSRSYGGRVKFFQRNGTNYETLVENISGMNVDLSADGSVLVTSDYYFDIGSSTGKVYLYDTTKPPAPTTSSSQLSPSLPMFNAKSSFVCILMLWMFW